MRLTIDQALQQGVVAHKESNLEEAERLYRAILQAQPEHPDANHNLGVIAVSSNKAKLAIPFFKAALKTNPKIEQFWLSYIDALIKENQLETAKVVLEKGKKTGLYGKKFDALEEQIIANRVGPNQQQISRLLEHYENREYYESEKLAKSLIKQFPFHQLSWKILGVVFGQTGRKSEALSANKTATQIDPQDAEAYNNLGITLKEIGRLEDSESCYKQAILLKPDYAQAYSNLGNTLQVLGKSKEAEASYRQAIGLKPDYAEAHSNLGVTLEVLGKPEAAEVSFRQAIKLEPNYPQAYSNLGNTLLQLGKVEEAEAVYRQAIALKPDFAEAHSNLANTLQELGKLAEAEASCRQAIVFKPDLVEPHNNLGNMLKELGELKEAEASYRQTIALKPDYAEGHYNLGGTLKELGELDLALASFERAVEIKKDFAGAKASVLETLYVLGRVEEVYQRIEIQSEADTKNIRIAALSSFLSKIEKKDAANNFCKNPMDFIRFSNISSHVKSSTEFIMRVIDELNDVKIIWEPFQKTTKKGFQTPNKLNLFANPSPQIARLKSIIVDELNLYYLRFRNEPCSYMQEWPSNNNLWGWHVILKHQGYQDPHIHVGGWLSGVVYLKVVPSIGKDEGAIEFSLNGSNYSNVNSPSLTHQPKEGDIVFFPSSLHHRTIPFTTDTDRIIVSFDLRPGN
jgi:tetratricopeptide (TPR) repeat protein